MPRAVLGAFLFKNDLFMAVRNLHCCTWTFSSCGEQGLATLAMVHGLLIAMASIVAEYRL